MHMGELLPELQKRFACNQNDIEINYSVQGNDVREEDTQG